MDAILHTILLLIGVLAVVAVAARRLRIAPSILLVVAGIALALIPGLPRVSLAPELVLLGILPPLIYSAGVAMSWREFRFNLRPIFLLAVGCVIFTTCAVAAAAHYVLGLPWAIGFVLGAIVAPPDVVAPLAIARRLGLPRRILVILEGEGLANDATALILYRFAVVAVSTGAFSLGKAGGTFALIVIGEIAFGVAVGWLSLRLRRWAHDPRVEITLSLITPYVAFWVPQYLGGSGVLATVACGLYVSWNGPQLISAATRLQGIFFWDLFVYLVEGFVFLLTGLEARIILETAKDFPVQQIVIATLLTTAIIIVARFIWVYPATYLPRWLFPAIRRRDPYPSWQQTFAIGFIGIRGVVSLAAALAIPLTVQSGAPFPHRDLILFVTFGVIIVTLIGQGLMLPPVIRWLRLGDNAAREHEREKKEEIAARRTAIDAAQKRLKELSRERKLSDGMMTLLSARHEVRSAQSPLDLAEGYDAVMLSSELRIELIAAERDALHKLYREGKVTDESRRRIERELDLEEESIACRRDAAAPL
ncbi:MAG: Na+/H+ antiporter [Pseudorhodoplanes sp.]